MTSKNDITGDEIKSKTTSQKFRDGWDRIFGRKKALKELGEELDVEMLINQITDDNRHPFLDDPAQGKEML